MKNGIVAAIVAIVVVASTIAVPLVPALGIFSVIKNNVILSGERIEVKDRQGGEYTADIENIRGVVKSEISDEEAAAHVKATNYLQLMKGETPIYSVEAKKENVMNVLLVAYDPDNILSRSIEDDVSIMFSLNLDKNSLKSYVINNNIYLPVEGYGWNRLGDAIEFGGLGLYINTINEVFKLDIQNYIMIDATLLPRLIDQLGGVDIEIDKETASKAEGLLEGVNTLNGETLYGLLKEKALGLENVFEKIGDKFGDVSKNTDITKMISSFIFMFKTNFPFNRLVKTIAKIVSSFKNGREDFSADFKDFTQNFHYAIADPEGYEGSVSVMVINDLPAEIERIRQEIFND